MEIYNDFELITEDSEQGEKIKSDFHRYFILFVLMPLLDVFWGLSEVSSLPKKLKSHLQELLKILLAYSRGDSTHQSIVEDWCIKSINMQLSEST